jgi:hypothetical protein
MCEVHTVIEVMDGDFTSVVTGEEERKKKKMVQKVNFHCQEVPHDM